MSWLKNAITNRGRISNNIKRYVDLKGKILRLKKIVSLSPTDVCDLTKEIMKHGLVEANPEIGNELKFLLSGENNQNVILDSPQRASESFDKIVGFINRKIFKETNDLRRLNEPAKEL